MSAPTELVKGNAAMLILSVLTREPMHGYKIVKELDRLRGSLSVTVNGEPHLVNWEILN